MIVARSNRKPSILICSRLAPRPGVGLKFTDKTQAVRAGDRLHFHPVYADTQPTLVRTATVGFKVRTAKPRRGDLYAQGTRRPLLRQDTGFQPYRRPTGRVAFELHLLSRDRQCNFGRRIYAEPVQYLQPNPKGMRYAYG